MKSTIFSRISGARFFGRTGESRIRKVLSAVLIAALSGAFFVALPQQASASTVFFSNIEEPPHYKDPVENQIPFSTVVRGNYWPGMIVKVDATSTVREVKVLLGEVVHLESVEKITAAFYENAQAKTGSRFQTKIGELTGGASYDPTSKILTITGEVEVPAGEVWLVFQSLVNLQSDLALTRSTSAAGGWTHTIPAYWEGGMSYFTFIRDFHQNGIENRSTQNLMVSIASGPTADPTDTTAPTLQTSTPNDGASGVLPNSDIVLDFDENVAKGTGNISIVRTSDNEAQAIDVTSAAVTVSGSTVTIDPPNDLVLNTAYHVLIDSTAIVDLADTPNAFAGITSPTALNFTTIGAPTLSSSSPSDDSENVPNNSNIVLNFSRDISGVIGKNITLVNLDTSAATVIAADDVQVSVSGGAVTINPTTDLEIATNYAVTFDAGAFIDANGIGVSALSDQSVLNFKTAKIPFAGLQVALDASISSSYSGTGDVWTDLSGNNNNLKLDADPDPDTDPKVLPSFNSTDKSLVFDASEGQHGFFWDGANPTLDLLNESEYTKLVWFKPTGLENSNNLFSSALKNAHALWGGGNDAACNLGGGDNLSSGHNGDWRTVQSGECLETQWQLVAVTFNSDSSADSAGWRMFRNGSLVGDSANTAVITDGSNETPNRMGYQTLIASYNYGNFFDGEIGQVYLYGRALSSVEVNNIFEASAAQYGLNLKTVTFNANGGTVDIESLKSNAGDGQVTLRTPSKSNAAFLGWFTQPTGGTRVGGAGDSYTPQADVTLFAQWDSVYTVTYSAGTNATGAPANATFQESVGAITLPTPVRADYIFDGWFTADSGGTKVGNAGQTYTPNADLTLHGRWIQASLAGINPADLSLVNSATMVNGVGVSNTLSIGSSSVSVNIPADALPAGAVVRVYSVANNNRAQALLPSESDFVNSMVVAWTATDTTVPIASSNLTMVIVDANIKAGAKVFSIVGDQSTLIATATEDGRVTVSFDTDPLVAIANPVAEPAPAPPSSGGGSLTATATPASVPSIAKDQLVRVSENYATQVTLLGENLELISQVFAGDQELTFTHTNGTSITINLPAMDAGSAQLTLKYETGELLHPIAIIEAASNQKVNAGSFNGVVALYAKGYKGQRLSAKVGEDWVIVQSIGSDYIRVIERTRWIGQPLKVRVYINRKLISTIDVVTK